MPRPPKTRTDQSVDASPSPTGDHSAPNERTGLDGASGGNQSGDGQLGNRLAAALSPYLLQHKDNPVHWRPWGPDAFHAAEQAKKPILLSVGYAACHWCHVMAHESFENPAIAALMNEHFINIKVDREERPDVDQIYQTALALLGEHGGWPLTMFLTPRAEPFWGGTYFPPEPRFGRPGFAEVLKRIHAVWTTDPDAIQNNVSALAHALQKIGAPQDERPAPLTPALLDTIAQRYLREIDPIHGGVGQAPKFPQPQIVDLLWRAFRRSRAPMFSHAVTLTLDRMCQGGIYDHLGGGFSRYATDAAWLVPHFEKMLYDNAQMLILLARVWAETKNVLYAERAAEIVAWLEREMLVEGAGFAASQDADAEGEEGKYYVWTESEIDVLLGEGAGAFKAAYGVRAGGNWEGRTILNRSAHPELGSAEAEDALARSRRVLFQARARRVPPGRDDKVLADWNGMTIAALVIAGGIFDRPNWIELGSRAFAFVAEKLGNQARLFHAYRSGRTSDVGLLDDYAQMSRAALALFEATGEKAYLERAKSWIAQANEYFWDRAQGGYFFTASDAEPLIVRTKNAHDHVAPSGNAAMAEALARLFYLTGDASYRERAERTIAAFAPELERNFFPLAGLVNAYEFLCDAVQVVVVGRRADPGFEGLAKQAFASGDPDLIVQLVAPGAEVAPSHPAFGKTDAAGPARAFVCRGQTCSLPITDPAALREALSGR
jgi:uncharacterized protein YyaL (SSP411 family)